MRKYNYYIELELDPSVDDVSLIETALNKKKGEWNKLKFHPRPEKSAKAAELSELVKDIERTMFDPNLREKESRDAIEILAEKVKAQEISLQQEIRILSAREFMLQTEFDDLIKEYIPPFTQDYIEKLITVDILTEAPRKRTEKPTLSKEYIQKIDANLETVGCETLYDFLKANKNESLTRINQRINELDAKLRQVNKINTVLTAKQSLIGLALVIFGSNEERAKYDTSLEEKKFKNIEKFVHKAGKHQKEISADVATAILEQAKKMGLDINAARDFIKAYATSKKWAIEVPQATSFDDLIKCVNCDELNDKDNKKCQNCGRSLYVECPQCGRRNLSENPYCSECGFATGDVHLVEELVKKADKHLAANKLEQAEKALKEAQGLWPDFNEIKDRLKAIEEERRKFDTLQRTLERLIAEKKLYEALEMASEGKRQYRDSEAINDLHKTITERLKEITSFLTNADACLQHNDTEGALEAYSAALTISADCREALEGRQKCAPPPPEKLNIAVERGKVRLQWPQVNSKYTVRYRILRNGERKPKSPTDGHELETSGQCHYVDNKAPTAKPIYYAVYSLREEVFSKTAAISEEPVFLAQPVAKLEAIAGLDSIRLQWKAPTTAERIEIIRSSLIDMPQEFVASENDRYVDKNVYTGQEYTYEIRAVFRLPNGRESKSELQTVSVKLKAPPEPVKITQINTVNNLAQIHFNNPENKQIFILKSNRPSRFSTGEAIAASEVEGELLDPQGMNVVEDDRAVAFQAVYYTPLIEHQKSYIVGYTKEYYYLEPITNICFRSVTDTDYVFRWDWPTLCEEALLVWSYGKKDWKAPQAAENQITVQRHVHEKNNGTAIKVDGEKDIFVAVYSIFELNGRKHLYEGADSRCEKLVPISSIIRIYYDFLPIKNFIGITKGYNLFIESKHLKHLPPLVAVAKQNRPPENKEDGFAKMKVDWYHLKEVRHNQASLTLPNEFTPKDVHVRLFCRKECDESRVEFRRMDENPK